MPNFPSPHGKHVPRTRGENSQDPERRRLAQGQKDTPEGQLSGRSTNCKAISARGGKNSPPPFFFKPHCEFLNANVSLELYSSPKQTANCSWPQSGQDLTAPRSCLATTVPQLAKAGASSTHPPTFSVYGPRGKRLWDSASTQTSSKTQRG